MELAISIRWESRNACSMPGIPIHVRGGRTAHAVGHGSTLPRGGCTMRVGTASAMRRVPERIPLAMPDSA